MASGASEDQAADEAWQDNRNSRQRDTQVIEEKIAAGAPGPLEAKKRRPFGRLEI
jgi:hypothetical protein